MRDFIILYLLFKEKIRAHLDLLSIPRLWGKIVKTFRWDQRLQIQTSSWHLNTFPDADSIGSTV